MRTQTAPTQTVGPTWAGRTAALPVYAFAASTLVFIWFSGLVEISYESRLMTVLLSAVVITGISAAGAWMTARAYLASGLPALLYAGCGLVAMGAGILISNWLIEDPAGPNDAVTVHNLSAFAASLFHFAAAARASQTRPGRLHPKAFKAALAYLGVLALTALCWAATHYDFAPDFFILGKGTTPVRQLVLTLSIAFLAAAAAFLLRDAQRRGSLALRCYGLGLCLIAMGLADVAIAVPGSILSWAGRVSQSLGHVYLLAAFMIAIRIAVQKGFDVKEAAADYHLDSESHYRTLVDALRAAVITIDPRGRVVLWNPPAESIFGYGFTEAAGQLLTSLIAPAESDRGPFLNELKVRSGRYQEMTLRRKDGAGIRADVLVFAAAGAWGEWTNLIIRDVTDREKSREEVAFLASFPRLNPNPIVEADLDGQVRFCNPAAERLFPDIRQRGTDHPWLSGWEAVWRSEAQSGAGMFHREVAIGDQWYHQTLHFLTEFQSVRIYGVDISELKATEQQRRIIHEQLVTILESISDGFFSLDRQFRVAFINERGARAIGQARETMLDRVLWEVFPEAVGSEFEYAYRTAMTDGVATTVEAFYPPLNAWFEARAFPYGDGISVFFRDITDRQRIEQSLRENQADLNWAQAVGRIGSWRLNIRRNELLWSDENHRIFGLPKGAPMSYETFLGIVHPEDREYVDRKWQAALRGESYDIVHRLVVGGHIKWVRERAELEFDAAGQLLGGFGITQDITEHKLVDEAMRASEARFRLLSHTAGELLTARHPQEHINTLAARVMTQLGCQCFFNFLVADGQPGRLKLNAWAGIPEEEARRIEWLDYGVAVCGCVARDGVRIVAEHIPTTPDVRTELVKSYGIKAYACHPLVGVNGSLLGTLSFGTRSRETFSEDDLALMKAVADQVAMALVRMQGERELQRSADALKLANERLEDNVRARTRELEDTVASLENEILVRKKIQTQLHQLSRKSLEALEADRRTIARELHDSIGGSLAAIKFGMEEVAERSEQDPACETPLIGALISNLADTIKETKRISANLRPLAIDDLGLLATIEWYTRQFCQRYGTIRIVCQIDVEEQEIPEEFKIVLYRVMQEALTNVSRHSQADAVTVRLTKSATHFEFEVEDNGCGFDTSNVFGGPDRLSGYGLKSMQERAEICGGVLNLRTRPNAGTSVKVSLPITAASGISASEADLAGNHAEAGRQI